MTSFHGQLSRTHTSASFVVCSNGTALYSTDALVDFFLYLSQTLVCCWFSVKPDQQFHPFHENWWLRILWKLPEAGTEVKIFTNKSTSMVRCQRNVWKPVLTNIRASVGAHHEQCDTRYWHTGLGRADRSTADSCCRELNEAQLLREGCLLSFRKASSFFCRLFLACFCRFAVD